ncbi:MAG: hypothetical protein ACRDKI_00910 [Solirubrobacterales bacterium]
MHAHRIRSAALAVSATVLLLITFAGAAGARSVVLEPCSAGADLGFGAFQDAGSYAQWTVSARCPAELMFNPIPGKIIGPGNPGLIYPADTTPHGTISKVSFDFLGGNGSDTGITQGVRVCGGSGYTDCGPMVLPASSDVKVAEHHEMTVANGQLPAGGGGYFVLRGICPTYPSTPCDPSRPLVVLNLKITFDDNTPPQVLPSQFEPAEIPDEDGVKHSLGVVPNAWTNTPKEFRVRATDTDGVGIKNVTYEIHADNYTLGATLYETSNSSAQCGGKQYTTLSIPYLCPQAVDSYHTWTSNEVDFQYATGQGLNHVAIRAFDAAGNQSNPYRFEVLADTFAPVVKDLHLVPNTSSRWSPTRHISLAWANQGEDVENEKQSGIDHAHYVVTSDDPYGPAGVSGNVPNPEDDVVHSIDGIEIPSDGHWKVTVTTVDRAGNTSAKATLDLSVDSVVPQAPQIAVPSTLSGQALDGGTKQLTWLRPSNAAEIASGICSYALLINRSAAADPGMFGGIAGDATSTLLPPALPNGTNWVHLRAISCSGVGGDIADVPFSVDVAAPAIEIDPPGPGGWYSETHKLRGHVDATGEGDLKMSAVPLGATDVWSSVSAIDGPLAEGTSQVVFKARDAAGNESKRIVSASGDITPPKVALSPPDPAHPTSVLARVTDTSSGVREAYMQYRAFGDTAWHSLGDVVRPSAVDSKKLDLSATIPDEDLPDGLYDLRVRASDVAEHAASAGTYADGAPAVLKLPLRAFTALDAGFPTVVKSERCSGKGKKRVCRTVTSAVSPPRLRDSTVVNYGARQAFAGTLRDAAGEPIGGAAIAIYETVGTASPVLVKRTQTDAKGAFSQILDIGASRAVTAKYSGDDSHAPAAASAKLYTRARITMSITRKLVAGRWRLTFGGQVTAPGAQIPASGKTVEVQYAGGDGTWESFPDTTTDQSGRWFYPQSFAAGHRAVKYKFRARVPWVDGWVYETGLSAAKTVVLR